jgi:2'-5' RNA ligase
MRIENNEFVLVFEGAEIRCNRLDIAEMLQQLLEKKAPSGVYVNVEPDEETRLDIYQFFKDQNIPGLIAPDEYHVTLMYAPDQEMADYEDKIDDDVGSMTATFYSYALYGEEKDCLVMVIESPELHAAHERLAALGLKATYEYYSPHLTLSYQGKDVDISKLPAPNFPFHFERFANVKAIDKDYKKNVATVAV